MTWREKCVGLRKTVVYSFYRKVSLGTSRTEVVSLIIFTYIYRVCECVHTSTCVAGLRLMVINLNNRGFLSIFVCGNSAVLPGFACRLPVQIHRTTSAVFLFTCRSPTSLINIYPARLGRPALVMCSKYDSSFERLLEAI